MQQGHGGFVITLLRMLHFLVTIMVHLILIIAKNIFCVLGEGPTGDINGNVAAAEQKFRINFT